jgi:hypothetical protein
MVYGGEIRGLLNLDLGGWSRSWNQAGGDVDRNSRKMQKSLDDFGMKTRQADADMKKTTGNMNRFGSTWGSVSNGIKKHSMAIGAAMSGMAAGIGMLLYMAVDKAIQAERAWGNFASSLKMSYTEWASVSDIWAERFDKLVKQTGRSKGELRDAGSALLQYGVTANNLERDLIYVSGLAAGKHVDAKQAAEWYGRALMGNGIVLKKLGVNLQDYGISMAEFKDMSMAEREAFLNQILAQKGYLIQNDAYANSTASKLEVLKAKWEGFMAKFGAALLPVLTPIVEGLTTILDKFMALQKAYPWINQLGAGFLVLLGVLLAVGGPLLIVKTLLGEIVGSVGDLGKRLRGLPGKKKIDINCTPDDVCNDWTSGRKKGSMKARITDFLSGAGTLTVPTLAVTGTLVAAGIATGHIANLMEEGKITGTPAMTRPLGALGPGGVWGGIFQGTATSLGRAYSGQSVGPGVIGKDLARGMLPDKNSILMYWNNLVMSINLKDALGKAFGKIDWMKILTLGMSGKGGSFKWPNFGDPFAGVKKWARTLRPFITNPLKALTGPIRNIWNTIKNQAIPIWNGLKNGIKNIGNNIRQGIVNAFNRIPGPARSAWNSVKNAVWGPVSKIMDLIRNLKSAIGAGGHNIGRYASPSMSLNMGAGGVDIFDYLLGDTRKPITGNPYNIGDSNCCGSNSGAGSSSLIGSISNAPKVWPKKIIGFANNLAGKFFGVGKFNSGNLQGLWHAFTNKIFGNLGYQFYFGNRYSPQEVLSRGAGNCMDLARLFCTITRAFGIPCNPMGRSFVGSTPHRWAITPFGNFDPTHFVHGGGWSVLGKAVSAGRSFGATARASAPPMMGDAQPIIMQLIFKGDTYGLSDFYDKVEEGAQILINKTIKKLNY